MTSTAKTVRLGELDHDPVVMAMPGQTERIKHLDDLLASIPEHGVLQSLKVRIAASSAPRSGEGANRLGDPGATRYLVTAGNRRFAALKALRDSGGAIRGVAVSNETQVPVVLSEETDDAAREQAVAENVQRVALTPGAEALQYAELARTAPVKEIAARFGVPEKRVKQRLALAGLHPDVLAALDAGKITLASASAFTVEPDPARQAKHLKKIDGKSWELEPRRIREALSQRLVSADSALAKIIGAKAYKAAGGEVLEDAFSDGKVVWWISGDVIDRLAEEHWAAQTEAWIADGWAFVAEAGEYKSNVNSFGYYYGRQFRPQNGKFTKAQKAGLGVLYWKDGKGEPVFGVIDEKKATPPEQPNHPVPPRVATLREPGWDLRKAMLEHLSSEIGACVGEDPLLALRVMVATLHYQIHAPTNGYAPTPFAIVIEYDDPAVRDENGELIGEEPEQGRTFASALDWAMRQDADALLAHLARLVAPGITDVDSQGALGLAVAAIGAVPFDAEAYFAAAPASVVEEAFRDMDAGKLGEGWEDSVRLLAAQEAKERGWLPPQLRTPAYAGPSHIIAADDAGEDDEDDDQDDEEFVEAAE